jgi:ribosomal protein L2
MNRKLGLAVLAGAIPLLLLSSTALGGEGIQLSIKNDGTDDILVTVYDMTVGPKAIVLSHMRISGFAAVPLSVAPDATGLGNVSWSAVTAAENGRKCGHADHVGLHDAASVTVRADSDCPATRPGSTAVTFQP